MAKGLVNMLGPVFPALLALDVHLTNREVSDHLDRTKMRPRKHCPRRRSSGDKLGTGLAMQDKLVYNAKHAWFSCIHRSGRDLQHITNAKAIQIQPS